MTTKEDLIQYINNKYQRMKKLLKDVAEDCEDSLRPMLEACVKLFWIIKYDKEPVWVNNGREEFILQKAIDDEKFSIFFSPFIISDMHSIRCLGNKTTHVNSKRLTANEISELVERLRRIIKKMEIVLGFPIIQFIQNEDDSFEISPNDITPKEKVLTETVLKHPLLNKKVKHLIYGEGEIIKVNGDLITIRFRNKQGEYEQSSFKNGLLTLIEKQPSQTIQAPKTYTPNPEIFKRHVQTPVIPPQSTPNHSISKSEAIRVFRNNGLNISTRSCTFASKNSMSYLYWANPKTDLLEEDWWLILNDNIKHTLHIFKIPANSLNTRRIKVRSDKPYLIDLQILFDDETFTDTRSNIQFSKWYIKSLSY